LPSVVFTTSVDYSFSKELMISQAYGLTYAHGCWGLTLVYREENNDQQVYFTVNLLGLGQLGAGLSPATGGMTFVQRPN